jgi:hypothetical protein
VKKIWKVISEEDRKILKFEISKMKWNKLLGESIMGVR